MSESTRLIMICAAGTFFGGACLAFLHSIYIQSRWSILDLLVTLVGGTLPMNLIAASRRSWDLQELAALALVGLGGVIAATFGSALGMRFIEGLSVRNPFGRAALLIMGWFALISIPAIVVSFILAAFVILDRRHGLIPGLLICASTALVWIPWWILAMRVKRRTARIFWQVGSSDASLSR